MDYVEKAISTQDFIHNHLSESIPLAFRNFSNHWEASSKWTDDYLNTIVGSNKVNISVYEHQQKDNLKKIKQINNLTFSQFLNDYLNKTDPNFDFFLDDFLDEKLMKDINTPEFMNFLDLNTVKIWKVNTFLNKGNGLSNSLPKSINSEILHCQLQGKSDIILSPALNRNAVYPYKKNVASPNLSGINFYYPDLNRFPNSGGLFKIFFILEKGDCLFIPSYWWHQFNSYNEPSLSVSFYFKTNSRYLDIIVKGIEEDLI